jgi:UDP-N-acetylmuramate: L-alanyl-gamma-D-glutamyl-meso-diaminopimelate ligase
VPLNFGISARLRRRARHFVIEADEYDTALFDKRSKFVHYRPRTAILNNLEHDHADIFPDLAAIETQFHHLGAHRAGAAAASWSTPATQALQRVLQRGCWTPRAALRHRWREEPGGAVRTRRAARLRRAARQPEARPRGVGAASASTTR